MKGGEHEPRTSPHLPSDPFYPAALVIFAALKKTITQPLTEVSNLTGDGKGKRRNLLSGRAMYDRLQ